MVDLRIISWNVNGLRAILKKGFMDFFDSIDADIICLQETKLQEAQVPGELREIPGYRVHFSSAERKGYSGVALFTRIPPISVRRGFGIRRFDMEGRILIAEYSSFVLFNIYFPNGKATAERLQYKMDFYDACLAEADRALDQGKNVIICGDVNTAHREIDLARPKQNEKISGFLPEERAWIDSLTSHGFVDTFRLFSTKGGQYTWWDLKSRARERNVGWRIDYFFASEGLKEHIASCTIHTDVMGSDHCPVSLELSGLPF